MQHLPPFASLLRRYAGPLTIGLTVAGYAVAFAPLYGVMGDVVWVLSLLPVVVAGLFGGARHGIGAALAFGVANVVLFVMLGRERSMTQTVLELGASVPVLLALGAGAGYLRRRGHATAGAEDRYRALFNAASDAILVFDPETEEVLDANDQALALYGRSRAELVGMSLKAVSRDPSQGESAIGRLMAWGGSERFESIQYRKDGSPFHVLISASVIEIDGRPAVLSINRDITEQKAAEEALRASEGRYRTVVETVHDVVFRTDAAGRWTFLSPAWERLTGHTAAESLGRPFTEFLHPDERTERFRDLAAATSIREEVLYRTKSGAACWAEFHAHVLRDAAGHVVGTAGIITDITATRRFEVEREAREKVEEMLRLKSAFLSSMSHELRTPLTGILGFAEVLAEEVDEDLRQPVEVIVRSARRLQETLNSVLDLAQLEGGTVRLQADPLDVLDEAREVLDLLRPLADRKGLALTLAGAPAIARADRAALHRVLNNLVGNALKFTREGSVAVTVDAADAGVRLRVRDTGVGISAAFLPHLFDEFQQESSGYARAFEGNGLGLAITRRLVELMNGSIGVESEVGVGSTFTVMLPHLPETSGDGQVAGLAVHVAEAT